MDTHSNAGPAPQVTPPARRLIVGITGATGAIFGVRLLEALRTTDLETHLVVSKWAQQTIEHETGYTTRQVREFASVVHEPANMGAAIASGSFLTTGMVVIPCSMRSVAAIAHGFSEHLIHRAADVVLKERRRLVLLVRETPLHLGHLRSMTQVTEMGAIVMPPVPAFYSLPQTIDDLVNQTVGRALDLFGIDTELVRRWPMTGPGTELTP